ncbi:hypothetical protein OH492_18350 [Vibrio chagasii]|nr:hypothetical protein [Vibrio chagasii]
MDPRLARMVISAPNNRCLHEVMVGCVCPFNPRPARTSIRQTAQSSDDKHTSVSSTKTQTSSPL